MDFAGLLESFAILAQATRRPRVMPEPSVRDWLTQPNGSVFLALLLAILIGGGTRWRQMTRARRAVDRVNGLTPPIEAIEELGLHGRAGLVDLFRLLAHPTRADLRDAAGRSLARLWKADEMVPEEEQAVVTRGHAIAWKARRRYPRALSRPIPMAVEVGLPFVGPGGDGLRSENLLWSARVAGTHRASQEAFGPWQPNPARVTFAIDPRDFPTSGPHRLILHVKAKTSGVTTIWERDLPQVPFSFELDPGLALEALLTMPDEARGSALARRIRLADAPATDPPAFAALDASIALQNPPLLEVTGPIPCDLAHSIYLEIEGSTSAIPAGTAVVAGESVRTSLRLPLEYLVATADLDLGPPGERRVRLVLRADPELGWADPDIRSVWPESIATEWHPARLIRR